MYICKDYDMVECGECASKPHPYITPCNEKRYCPRRKINTYCVPYVPVSFKNEIERILEI
jgi:hypothetical protein